MSEETTNPEEVTPVETTPIIPLNYSAITINPVMPTRSNGMGKIMIEILNIHLLTNKIILRDWIIVQDEDDNEIHREIIRDNYEKYYPDTAFSMLFTATEIALDSPTENYSRLKEIADEAIILMNNFDPPYSLPIDSFEKYISKMPMPMPMPMPL